MIKVGALHRVHWDFGRSKFHSLTITIKIYNEPKARVYELKGGLYFQMFHGWCNGVGFYFGIQTDVHKKGYGYTGKGLIFSRWETRDLSNTRPVDDGWSECDYENGCFVSIRKNYDWTTHIYQLKIAYMETDDKGDWYGVWINDLDENIEDLLGSIRFPKTEPEEAGIKDHGAPSRQTFTELYDKKVEAPIPTWHVSIREIYVDDRVAPKCATLQYGKISNTDAYFEGLTGEIHLLIGPKLSRKRDAGKLF